MLTRAAVNPSAPSRSSAWSAGMPVTLGTGFSAPLSLLAVGTAGGNAVTGVWARAALMYSCQIWAGHVPPCTLTRVTGGTIERWASAKPTHTDVTNSGVNPTNQASRH